MKLRCTAKGYVGLTVGVTAGIFYLLAAILGTPATAPAQEKTGARSPAPTETIDVEQAVDFPYDI